MQVIGAWPINSLWLCSNGILKGCATYFWMGITCWATEIAVLLLLVAQHRPSTSITDNLIQPTLAAQGELHYLKVVEESREQKRSEFFYWLISQRKRSECSLFLLTHPASQDGSTNISFFIPSGHVFPCFCLLATGYTIDRVLWP